MPTPEICLRLQPPLPFSARKPLQARTCSVVEDGIPEDGTSRGGRRVLPTEVNMKQAYQDAWGPTPAGGVYRLPCEMARVQVGDVDCCMVAQ